MDEAAPLLPCPGSADALPSPHSPHSPPSLQPLTIDGYEDGDGDGGGDVDTSMYMSAPSLEPLHPAPAAESAYLSGLVNNMLVSPL